MKTWVHRISGCNGLEIGLEWRCWSLSLVLSLPRFYLERSEGGNIVWCNFKKIDMDAALFEAGAVPMVATSAQLDAAQQSIESGRASDEIVTREGSQHAG